MMSSSVSSSKRCSEQPGGAPVNVGYDLQVYGFKMPLYLTKQYIMVLRRNLLTSCNTIDLQGVRANLPSGYCLLSVPRHSLNLISWAFRVSTPKIWTFPTTDDLAELSTSSRLKRQQTEVTCGVHVCWKKVNVFACLCVW